tara:strand:- start:903 stop:1352 length:450 start_codon:yes stop_codon:yes gene_type:complete
LSTDFSSIIIGLGVLCFIVEALAFGFSLVVLASFGLSLIVTGLLMNFGFISSSMGVSFSVIGILTILITAVLWVPLKKLGQTTRHEAVASDLVGHRFRIDTDLTIGENLAHRYSGVDWMAKGITHIEAGSMVEVKQVEVGVLWVAKVED